MRSSLLRALAVSGAFVAILADGSATAVNVIANSINPNTRTTRGAAGFPLANAVVALPARARPARDRTGETWRPGPDGPQR